MRTPGERTSGAWTGGCAIHPDGGDETDRTAGNSYTATPHNTQGANSGPAEVIHTRSAHLLRRERVRTMGIRMEVKLTDGYQQRFTSACLAQIGSRKEVTKIEDGNEGWKDHADRSGQHTDGDHKILELNEVRPAQEHDDRRLQQGTAGQALQNRETATGHRKLQAAIG